MRKRSIKHQSNVQRLHLNSLFISPRWATLLLCLGYIYIAPTPLLAHQINIDITGLSYHIGANSKDPAYANAPRALDKNGAFVFNPGISLGWDFRPINKKGGFSCITKAIYFRDCDDRGFIIVGAGGRYRYFFHEQISGDINLLATLAAGQKWKNSSYRRSFLPLLLLGINYHFKNDMALGANFTLAPKNSSFDATGSFWILFSTLQLTFPIYLQSK